MGQIFRHPVGHNIEWRDVLSLLEAVGSVEETHHGKFLVTLGGETEPFEPPRHKDIEAQQVVDLRRMLGNAGYGPAAGSGASGSHGVLRDGSRRESRNPLSVAAASDASCRGQFAAIGELAGQVQLVDSAVFDWSSDLDEPPQP